MWDTHVQYGGIVHVLASCSHARTCALGRTHAWSVTRQSWWLQSSSWLPSGVIKRGLKIHH